MFCTTPFCVLPFASAGPVSGSSALDFESALVATLKADEELSAIVADRVYPLAIPETGRLPCLVYAITSTDRVRNLNGPAGVATARVLIDARSTLHSEVKALQEALRRYDGYSGTLAGAVEVLYTRFDDQGDEFEWPAGSGGSQGTRHLTLEFRFKYREPFTAALD